MYIRHLSGSTTDINFLLDIDYDEKWNDVMNELNRMDDYFYYWYNDHHASFLTCSTTSGDSSRSGRGSWVDKENGNTNQGARYMAMQTIEQPKAVSSGGSSFASVSPTQFEIQSMSSSSSSALYS